MPHLSRAALALIAFGIGGLVGPAPPRPPEPTAAAPRYAIAITRDDALRLAPRGVLVPAESAGRTLACAGLMSIGVLDVGVRCAAVRRRTMDLAVAE
jgi:hypothetical protein